jgi:hypothetical protein
MGLTVLTLDVTAPHDPTRHEAVDFLVDSGAIYSFVPRPVSDPPHYQIDVGLTPAELRQHLKNGTRYLETCPARSLPLGSSPAHSFTN